MANELLNGVPWYAEGVWQREVNKLLAGSGQEIGPAPALFVNTEDGDDDNDGLSWDTAKLTMASALSAVQSRGTVFFAGDVREEVVGDNLKFDVTIIGVGNKPHHPDLPAAGYSTGASAWRPPASPTAATPLLTIRGRGWSLINILFDAPVDAAAVLLETNSESGEDEYSAGHATFLGCRFDAGQSGIEDSGGSGFVLVERCDFRGLTNAIKSLNTSNAIPLRWEIRDNTFMDNENHVIMSLSRSVIRGNVFGKFGTEAINTISISAQGEENVVCGNYLYGDYDTAEGYTPDTTDTWVGNYAMLTTGSPSGDGAINVLPTS